MLVSNRSRLKATFRWSGVALFVVVISAMPILSFAEDRRGEVLIYYANETAPEGREASNYDTIIEWLRTGTHAKHAHIADSLVRDRRIFAAAADVETDVLLHEIPRLANGPQAVIVTNRLIRQGKGLIWRRGQERFQETEFPAPHDENYILAANPLSRSETLRDVLAFVATEFSPIEHKLRSYHQIPRKSPDGNHTTAGCAGRRNQPTRNPPCSRRASWRRPITGLGRPIGDFQGGLLLDPR